MDPTFADNTFRGLSDVQALNPDGRLNGYPESPYYGAVADINAAPATFFEAAEAIARRSDDHAFRMGVYQEMSQFLDWYTSPVKRDGATGLITGTWEELDYDDGNGIPDYQVVAPVGLNVEVAVAAEKTAELAGLLGKKSDRTRYSALFIQLAKAVNEHLSDRDSGTYHGRNLRTSQFVTHDTAAMFYPLRLKIAPEARRRRLIEILTDKKKFNFGLTPGCAKEECVSTPSETCSSASPPKA